MSLKLPTTVGHQNVLKEGTQVQHGVDESIYRNIAAVNQLATITRSSFGPNGLNKLIVNNLDKLFMTADAGTILKELQVQHPAARIVIEASAQQDAECGDGSNLVVVLAAALLEGAKELLTMGLKASVVAHGFRLGKRKALEVLEQECIVTLDGASRLDSIVKTVLCAKQCGQEDHLTALVMKAVQSINTESPIIDHTYQLVNPDNVRCVKILGGCLSDSQVIPGVVLSRGVETKASGVSGRCRVAVFSCPVDISNVETKSTVLFNNANEMMNYSKGEEVIIKDKITNLHSLGVKVVVTGEKIGEMALHYLNHYGMVGIRVTSKFDLQRLSKACQAPVLLSFDQTLDDQSFGWCDEVGVVEFGGDRCEVVRSSASEIVSIVLRGASLNVLDEVERAIEDAINVVRVLSKRDDRVVPGAGACEQYLARQLRSFAISTVGLIQYPLGKVAEAFESIPGLLAANAGLDRTDSIARLSAANKLTIGINHMATRESILVDTMQSRCVDSWAVKARAIELAFTAADSVLMSDHIIMSKPAGGPKPRAAASMD